MGMFDYLKTEYPLPLPGSHYFFEQKRPRRYAAWLCAIASKSEPRAQSPAAQPLGISTRASPRQSPPLDEYRLDSSAPMRESPVQSRCTVIDKQSEAFSNWLAPFSALTAGVSR